MARIEAGIPRYGQDMDDTNIPLEAGLEARAISYAKGCCIGQEVINRIHSVGRVARELRGLRLADALPQLPARGDKLYHAGKEVGHVTSTLNAPPHSAVASHWDMCGVKSIKQGTALSLVPSQTNPQATIVDLPFS